LKALEIDETNPKAYYRLALVSNIFSSNCRTIATCETNEEKKKKLTRGLQAYAQLGYYENAEEKLKKAAELEPNDRAIRAEMHRVARLKREAEEQVREIDRDRR
jgi:tetratricopeptide (TPR) repeat protein